MPAPLTVCPGDQLRSHPMRRTPEPNFAEVYRAAAPLFEAAAQKIDPSHAVEVVHLVLTWRFLRDYLGRDPIAREHYTALEISKATYWRRMARMREAYGVEHPRDIAIAPEARLAIH